jgi:probable DNA repair protein
MRLEHQNIIQSLLSGKRFVTASQRQSRFIQALWQNHKINELKTLGSIPQSWCWEQANCISWDDWLLENFELCNLQLSLHGKPTKKLLSTLEVRWLWQNYLKKINSTGFQLGKNPLTQTHSLLNSLLQAWSLFQNWNLKYLDALKNEFNVSEESRLFIQLVELFDDECKTNEWISKQTLSDFVAEHFEFWEEQSNQTICYYGFDDWTPQQQYFLEQTSNLKSEDFSQLEKPKSSHKVAEKLHPCASKYAEWQQAANWARQQAENNTEKQIAVVIPSLSNDRAQILRIFQEAFQPKLQIEAEAKVPQGFNISVGEPFHQQAIIQSARNWFSLVKGADGKAWKAAIVDGFCEAANTERWARAALVNSIVLNNSKFYSISSIQKLISENNVVPVAKLSSILAVLKNQEESAKEKKSSGEWCLFLEKFLTEINWPGDKTILSQAFQAKNQWLEKFRQLSAVDQFCGQLSLADFLKLLDEQMQNSKFQPETPAARVQVLGLLEAIGLSFDSIWLCGCQDNVFPAPLNASPWLPVHIQQAHVMPGASAQREQKFAENLFTGMQNNTDEIHYSYALTDADAELKPTALLDHLFERSISDSQVIVEQASELLPKYWRKQLHSGTPFIKKWKDNQGEKISSTNVKSGVAILKNQASCPFKAYAEFRLNAAPKREATIGIDPILRGNWVHDVLEMVWLRLGTQQALLDLTDIQQLELVRNCATEIIYRPSKKIQEIDNNSPLIQLEFERTVALVMLWLDIDRNRSEHFKVAVEQTQEINISNLSFIVRADRIDEMENGQKLIIDYKTGKTTTSSWFKERITEPQLPLYGLIFTDNLAAIAIAELTPASTKLKGFGDESLEVTGIKPIEDWQQLIQQWQINLETVAAEYSQGYAAVDPDQDSCAYCEYAHLCRRDSYFIESQPEPDVERQNRGDV